MALRAKLYFDRHIIFEISLREISKMMCLSKYYSAAEGGKRHFTQPQDYFDRHIMFEISQSEISNMMCLSIDNLARSAVKSLFAQPQDPHWKKIALFYLNDYPLQQV